VSLAARRTTMVTTRSLRRASESGSSQISTPPSSHKNGKKKERTTIMDSTNIVNAKMEEMDAIRKTLEAVRSHEIPESFRTYITEDHSQQAVTKENRETLLYVSETIQKRYQLAKERFIQKRFEELFIQYVSTYDGKSFALPVTKGEEARKETQEQCKILVQKIVVATNKVTEQCEALRLKYRTLQHRLKILEAEAEKLEKEIDGDEDNRMDEDEIIDEDLIAAQQQELDKALSDQMKIKAELARLEMQQTHLKAKREFFLQRLNSVPLPPHGQENNQRSSSVVSNMDVDSETVGGNIFKNSVAARPITDETNLEEFQEELRTELERVKAKTEEMQDLASWYDHLRISLEYLGGMRILDITCLVPDGLRIQIQLLELHTIEITLQSRKQNPSAQPALSPDEELMISSARLLEGPNLTLGTGPVQVSIPVDLPQDLVEIAQNELLLPQREDLKFILHETIARIRGLTCRVEELEKLRKVYLTKIDRNGDEVVCSLNEGVTVVLNLSPDCPMVSFNFVQFYSLCCTLHDYIVFSQLKGSASVVQIVGLGGWSNSELDNIRSKVNNGNHKGPLELMNALREEVQQRKSSLPQTPLNLARSMR